MPLTVRGGGTGNYGQAMPLRGGIVLDLSELTAVKAIGHGRVRAEAGIKLAELDAATIADSRQELRLHPSTHKTGTIGGYVAGGSSGIGSITWGLLRDRGNILMARVVTMEAEPRILELRGADIQKVNHAYGTNGIITELEVPLAPAYRWAELSWPSRTSRPPPASPTRWRTRTRSSRSWSRWSRHRWRTTTCSPSGWRRARAWSW